MLGTDSKHQELQNLNASSVVRNFYSTLNKGDVKGALQYFSKDVVYRDMVYQKPFKGIQDLEDFLMFVHEQIPDLKFIIDAISENDQEQLGVQWHVEVGNKTVLPNSNGVSFIRLNKDKKIEYCCDCAEPAVKLNSFIFPVIKRLGRLHYDLPQHMISRILNTSILGAVLTLMYLAYITELFFNPWGAGGNVLNVDTNQIYPMFDVSLNIYFIGDICQYYNIPYFPVKHHHPVYESVFNVMVIWALIFLPFMLTDYRSRKMAQFRWWIGSYFLTNVFMLPYLIIRQQQPLEEHDFQARQKNKPLNVWSRVLGVAIIPTMIYFIYWGYFGGQMTWEQRKTAFQDMYHNDKVFNSYVIDCTLFYIWQFVIVRAPLAFQAVPFFGPALWLILYPQQKIKKE